MKKIFITLFLFLPVFVFPGNWYLSTTSSGNASANSWANKRILSNFNWSQVQPGDTVWVDGGTSGLTYNYGLIPAVSGTAGNQIVITRGLDLGHNGLPTFSVAMSANNYAAKIYYNYLTINDLKFIGTGGNEYQMIHITGNYIDFTNNTVNNTTTKAMRIEGDGVRVLNNLIDTGVINVNSATDGLWIGGGGHSLEVAYNRILMRNVETGGQHKDNIQSYMWQTDGTGTTKIHHNFFYSAEPSASSNTVFELSAIGGNWEIYDNIIVYGGSGGGRAMYLGNCDSEGMDGEVFSAKIYNNTFYIANGTYVAAMFADTDTLSFKNNLVYSSSGMYNGLLLDAITMDGVLDIDYNQYVISSSSDFLYAWECLGNASSYTWSQWRSTYGQDAHSEIFTNSSAIDFVGSSFPSITPSDYALVSGSSGINEGTSLTLFSDDYAGVSRPQNGSWDLGAFEYTENSGDTTPPNLQGAILNSSTILILNFSEPLNSTTAQNKNNYSISNGITVSSAVLSGTQVTLTTSVHVSGAYTVTVNTVTDLSGNVINPNNNTASYNYNPGDVTPPQVLSAVLIDSVSLNIFFSENLESNSAQNINNYTINGISIINATLNGNVVRLSTSPHTYGLYQVTVNNVTDVAGNLISVQNNSYMYEYSNSINNVLRLNIFQAKALHWYEDLTPDKSIDGITSGESRWGGSISMPDTIIFSLDDIQILNTTKLSFYKWDQGRIYNYSILVSIDSISWNQIRNNIPSLSLQWSIEEVDPIEARYIKIILLSNNQNLYAELCEAEFWGHLKIPANNEDEEFIPLEFSLDQNYPNPFNPSTKISWQTSAGSYNTIKVYDVLGNEVATLVDEFKPVGSYEVEFNTSSTAGELTSGVYFYRLQTTPSAGSGQAFTQTKKMVLLR